MRSELGCERKAGMGRFVWVIFWGVAGVLSVGAQESSEVRPVHLGVVEIWAPRVRGGGGGGCGGGGGVGGGAGGEGGGGERVCDAGDGVAV